MESAEEVGWRHGKPAILVIQSCRMAEDGYPFYKAENGKINVSVSLIYNLPLSKTEEIKNVMEDGSAPIETAPADTVKTATDTIPEREQRIKEPEATSAPIFEE